MEKYLTVISGIARISGVTVLRVIRFQFSNCNIAGACPIDSLPSPFYPPLTPEAKMADDHKLFK